MWTFLLDPSTQGVLVVCALGVLAWVAFDLAQEVRAPSASAKFRRGEARVERAEAPRRRPVEPMLDIWTDAAGLTQGHVRRGPCAGRRLEELSRADCGAQAAYARAHDPAAAPTLEAYMRKRFATPPARDEGAMTRAQALRELGLTEGASAADIHAGYLREIKRHHPDHGGSHVKAARINAAKDSLTG